MDQKSVVMQLRALASDPENQTYIVREQGCIQGLIGFLDSADEEVQLIAVQALHFLSSHPNNREPLAEQPGLVSSLVKLSESSNKNLSHFSSEMLSNLESCINGQTSPSERVAESAGTSFQQKQLHTQIFNVRLSNGESDRERVERALLGVQGVISVTTDIRDQRTTVYSTTTSNEADLLRVLRDLGTEPSKPQASAAQGAQASNMANPSYGAVAQKTAPTYLNSSKTTSRNAITRYATAQSSSLEARLAVQRKKKEQQKEKESTITSMAKKVTGWFW